MSTPYLNYSESHPLKPYPINEQSLSKEDFIQKFNDFQWEKLLEEQINAPEHQIKCSPSLNLENSDNKIIAASIVGELDNYEFYIYYKRPTVVKKRKWLGLIEYDFYDENFFSLLPEQTKQNALEAFLLFYDENYSELEKKYG